MLLQGLITLLVMLIMLWSGGLLQSKEKRADVLDKKADKSLVEKRFANHIHIFEANQNAKIDSKADKSLVESMDGKLDLILMRLK
jgi:hypothetical protein